MCVRACVDAALCLWLTASEPLREHVRVGVRVWIIALCLWLTASELLCFCGEALKVSASRAVLPFSAVVARFFLSLSLELHNFFWRLSFCACFSLANFPPQLSSCSCELSTTAHFDSPLMPTPTHRIPSHSTQATRRSSSKSTSNRCHRSRAAQCQSWCASGRQRRKCTKARTARYGDTRP